MEDFAEIQLSPIPIKTKAGTKTKAQHKHFAFLLVIKNLPTKNKPSINNAEAKMLNGLRLNLKPVCAKKFETSWIKSNEKLQIFSKNPINGKIAATKAKTNNSGYNTEKIGTTIKFAKTESKLSVEKIFAENGRIPIVAEIETAIDTAIGFGSAFPNHLLNTGAITKIETTQKMLI